MNPIGYSWIIHGVTQYYVLAVLPFGLASACFAFTKLLRPLIRYWRGQGLRAILYLYNGIVAVSEKEAAKAASFRVRKDLAKAGLVEHTDKCSWVSARQTTWLGFQLDLNKSITSVPNTKIATLKSLLNHALPVKSSPASHYNW